MNKTDLAADRPRDPSRAKSASNHPVRSKEKQEPPRKSGRGDVSLRATSRQAVAEAAEQAKPSKEAPAVSTIRFTKRLADGLRLLQATSGKNVNALVSEAVSEFLVRRLPAVESDIVSMLDMMKAYRRENPEFEADLQAFVADEAANAGQDPLEGRIVRINRLTAGPKKSAKAQAQERTAAVSVANRAVFGG